MAAAPIPAPAPLQPGDPAPWFHAPALSGAPNYGFGTVAGRHVLMLFFGSARLDSAAAALRTVQENRALLDDRRACFFGVTADPEDQSAGRIEQQLPGIRYFLDYDRRVSTLYGAAAGDQYLPHWLLLDPSLQVIGTFPLAEGERAFAALHAALEAPPADLWAPVLRVPNVLEPELCRALIDLYETVGGEESGFMREVNGKTVGITDNQMKQRKDCQIPDERMRAVLTARLERRVAPMIARAFQFQASRIERYIVACYEAGAGHFRPHRDNTTRGTAHRKFAVSINLNAEEHEGGDLRFPEYGGRTYRPPTGGAIVFSCSILHEATPVTAGRRYAFLPFLYDEAGARIREANAAFLEGGSAYKA